MKSECLAKINYCNIDVLNQIWEAGDEYSYEEKRRPFFGMCFIISGDIVYKTSKGEIAATGGDVVILKEKINYKAFFKNEGTENEGTKDILVNFSCENCCEKERFFDFFEDDIKVFEKKGKLKKLFSDMLAFRLCGERECLVKARFYEILDSLLNGETKDEFSEKLRGIVEADYSANIKIEEAAKQFSVSASTFQRMLKTKCGKTFYQYKTEIKMLKAKELLAERKHSTAEISEMLGFFDNSYFFKVFKRFEGISPRGYQKELYKM